MKTASSMAPKTAARMAIWELDVECHGPPVGSCWTMAELRRLTDRQFEGRSSLDDFALHAAVVTHCATRKLSLAIQHALVQRSREVLGSWPDLAGLEDRDRA